MGPSKLEIGLTIFFALIGLGIMMHDLGPVVTVLIAIAVILWKILMTLTKRCENPRQP